jgi:hypothetical protein
MEHEQGKSNEAQSGQLRQADVSGSALIIHPASRPVVVESCAVYGCLAPAIGLRQDLQNGVSIAFCQKHTELTEEDFEDY